MIRSVSAAAGPKACQQDQQAETDLPSLFKLRSLGSGDARLAQKFAGVEHQAKPDAAGNGMPLGKCLAIDRHSEQELSRWGDILKNPNRGVREAAGRGDEGRERHDGNIFEVPINKALRPGEGKKTLMPLGSVIARHVSQAMQGVKTRAVSKNSPTRASTGVILRTRP